MGAKKIIKHIADFLNIANFTMDGKKKALKELLLKLKNKRLAVLKELKKELESQEREELEEELELISFHIRKAKKKLEDT